MTDDPCLNCPLPDCDETSKQCRVNALYRSYGNKLKRGLRDQITDEERTAASIHFEMWSLSRALEAQEGGRPFSRGRRVYGPEQHGDHA